MILLQIILYVAMLYNIAMAAVILLRKNSHQAGGSFAWYILSTAAWTACVATMQFTGNSERTLWLCRATFFFSTLFGISWLWFCADFPVTSDKFRKVALALTIISLPWLFLCWTSSLITSVTYMEWGVDAGVGPLVGVYGVWLLLLPTIGAIHLYFKSKVVTGFEKLQIRYILLGYAGLLLFASMTNVILPALTHSSRFGPYGPLASLFVNTTTTYAIVRYRLMDIRIVLRASLVYTITIGTLSLFFALLVPIMDHALATRISFFPRAGSFIMAFLIALAFQPLLRHVQTIVDKRFFKSVYDYRAILREAGSALASAQDRDTLVDTLINALIRTLRPRSAAIYLPGHNDEIVRISSTEAWEQLPVNITSNDTVLAYCLETDEVLVSEELIRQEDMQYFVGKKLQQWNVYVLIPLIANERLCGIIFLGEKLSGDVYTADDIGLLRILGKQAAIAMDNARHYAEVVLLNEYHERLLHSMQDGVMALDPNQQIITFNHAAEHITAIPASEAIGKKLGEIGIDYLLIQNSGDQPIEIALRSRNSNQDIPLLINVTPFRQRWDTADSHLVVFKDLSALRTLEQEKMQAERFSSMGAMAASLAHEIKNPLVPINMFAHLLPTKYDDEEFRKEFSVTVVNEVERINRLVGQMLDMVQKPTHNRDLVNIQEVIDRLLVIVRPECQRHNVEIKLTTGNDLPKIMGLAREIYQAILNVIMNSIQAMPQGGILTISVEQRLADIICRISDTGSGVSQDNIARIFEPLYTTKVGGHGLGLALTYQFIRSNGGEARAECAPGNGLTITLILPVCEHPTEELLCT